MSPAHRLQQEMGLPVNVLQRARRPRKVSMRNFLEAKLGVEAATAALEKVWIVCVCVCVCVECTGMCVCVCECVCVCVCVCGWDKASMNMLLNY